MNEEIERRLEAWVRSSGAVASPAIVLGGSVNGLSFVRSLSRRGVATLMMDSENVIGMYTRRATIALLRSANEYPEEWLKCFEFLSDRLARPAVLFATSDEHSVFVAEHADRLRDRFRFLLPAQETIERIVNKRNQYAVAEQAGISIPNTRFPGSVEEAAIIAKEFPFPCILKPYKSHIARRKIPKKVVVVRSSSELVNEYRRLATGDVMYMIQEIIPGEDTDLYGYLGFWDETGEHSWLTKRKLRQNPPLYGDGSLQVTVEAPKLAELSRRLLAAFDYRGFVGIEYKQDRRDGVFKLMEINPRTVSGNQLAISAGVDFPWIGYRYLIGDPLPRSGSFRRGVKYVNEEWDLKAFLALRRSGQLTLGRWLRSLKDVSARAIFEPGDPRPMVVVLLRIARAFFRRVWTRKAAVHESDR